MVTLTDREKAMENKFAHDSESEFKLRARRNKILGEWAAAKLSLSGKDAEEYAFSIVDEDMRLPGDSDVIEKIVNDFKKASVNISEAEINAELKRAMEKARK